MRNTKHKLRYPQLIVIIFLLFIIVGTILLMLPISARDGEWTPFIDALFTATAANCVTGMTVYDIYTHWSLFGQIVILILVQIGGLGFMSVATIFSLALKRKIGLNERMLMQEAAGSLKLSGIVRLTKHLLLGTLFFESIGTIILAFRFCPRMGLAEGLYNAFFHSVSAFCNAGLDLMGKYKPFSSLEPFANDSYVCLTIAALVVIGGLGFMVWEDFYVHKWNYKKYMLHTKVVLLTTVVLIIVPTILIFIAEVDKSLLGMKFPDQVVNALFHSISPRTAGFSLSDINEFSDSTVFITIILMFIGGAPGSTAGGIKVTTIFLLFAVAVSVLKGRSDVTAFKRRFEEGLIKKAIALIVIYMSAAITAIAIINIAQEFPLKILIFEVFAAISTAGASLGITTELSLIPKITIIVLMYFGRVGIMSIVFSFMRSNKPLSLRYPPEKLTIG